MVATSQRGSDVFAAIGHPARWRMLDLLTAGESGVAALAAHFEMSRPAVSQHLRILLDAGLVTEQRHGRERRYRFVPDNLGPVRDWLAQYERFWDERLNKLRTLVAEKSKS
ncbi:MAG: metalloregulator ArsR/SmtB family transcription factor [Pirellulales bacterium]